MIIIQRSVKDYEKKVMCDILLIHLIMVGLSMYDIERFSLPNVSSRSNYK